MIAYNLTGLYNLFIRRETEATFNDNCITKEERDAVYDKYPVLFYTPNIFIRIGLFLLTVIILSFSFGLLSLLFINNIEKIVGGLAVFFALLAFAALEIMIKIKKHYQSGVDDALLWGASAALFCGISLPNDFSMLINCVLLFMITLFGTLRYADRLMATTMYISIPGFVFFAAIKFGPGAKAVIPFVIMAISLFVYSAVKKVNKKPFYHVYADCLTIIEIVSLTSIYVAGNYWVVRELSNNMFGLNLLPEQSIPFGWLFWIFTFFIPLVYIFRGIQKKEVILLRVGLLLLATLVFTVRYYNSISPIETWMVIAGIILAGIAFVVTHYLRTPKYGFTIKELHSNNAAGKINIEALILAETFSQQDADTGGTEFGGGSFGGGGASGDF